MSFTDSSSNREVSVLEKLLNAPISKPKWYAKFLCCFYKY